MSRRGASAASQTRASYGTDSVTSRLVNWRTRMIDAQHYSAAQLSVHPPLIPSENPVSRIPREGGRAHGRAIQPLPLSQFRGARGTTRPRVIAFISRTMKPICDAVCCPPPHPPVPSLCFVSLPSLTSLPSLSLFLSYLISHTALPASTTGRLCHSLFRQKMHHDDDPVPCTASFKRFDLRGCAHVKSKSRSVFSARVIDFQCASRDVCSSNRAWIHVTMAVDHRLSSFRDRSSYRIDLLCSSRLI